MDSLVSAWGGGLLGPAITFWGKYSREAEDAGLRWHPLIDHCADVAACCEAILRHTALGARIARLAALPVLDERHVQRLSVLAALHDVGKFNLGFQRKIDPEARITAGHVQEVVDLLTTPSPQRTRFLDALDIRSLLAWGNEGALQGLLMASVAHHGRPAGQPRPARAELWSAANGLDPFAGLASLRMHLERWFPAAFEGGGAALPDAPRSQHAFSGLVMLADWLGSDTRFFPYSPDTSSDRMSFAREASSHAVRSVGLDTREAAQALRTRPIAFDLIDPRLRPRALQRTVLEDAVSSRGSLRIVESETGSGKTEAAFLHFLALLRGGLVDGMYFALPTRTSATQIHSRVTRMVAQAFPESARPPVVLAVPGYVVVDDASATRLPGFEVLWNDDAGERFRFRGWAAENPKRFLAGAIVVGTIDQALLSALAVSHAELRASALLRHLLVVDEVHASDSYMNRILESVLGNHLQAGGHALLMSATLGNDVAARLASTHGRPVAPLSLEDAREATYPAWHVLEEGSTRIVPIPPPENVKRVETSLALEMSDFGSVARRALDAAASGARVLVLRNTVAACIETQAAVEAIGGARFSLRCADVPTVHHSRFAKADRESLDLALESAVGVGASAGGCIVVATQTVQQSLDIDFDFLLTDLCPMDVLLQRIGRLHRHARVDRPDGFRDARVVVLLPDERDLDAYLDSRGVCRGPCGIGTVYPDLLVLEATRRALVERPHITIPHDNRWLVESAVHPEMLDRLAERLDGAWAAHRRAIRGCEIAKRGKGQLALIDRDIACDDDQGQFPPRDLQATITTRLGDSDRLVRLSPPVVSAFGNRIAEISVPGWLARGVGEDASEVAATASLADGTAHFVWGGLSFLYDRWGLRRVDASSMPNAETWDG